MNHEQRQDFFPRIFSRFCVNKMHIQSINVCLEMITESVQFGLSLAPIVLFQPMVGKGFRQKLGVSSVVKRVDKRRSINL